MTTPIVNPYPLWLEQYWVTSVALFLNGILSLYRLHRLREKHHLYLGALLCWVPFWPVRIFAWLNLLDDSVQHLVQAQDLEDGRTPRPDWTPGHKFYVFLATTFGYTGS